VQICVVGGLDVRVFTIVSCNCRRVAVVKHALAFLLLVVFSESCAVLHLDSTVVVNPVGAKCAVEAECVTLALEVIWIVVLACFVSVTLDLSACVA
jgi:hypothetical protein